MDLDFSFALVSSLTPRSQRTPLTDNKRHPAKLLKSKQNQSAPPIPSNNTCLQKRTEEKENHSPSEQLMNKNDLYKISEVPQIQRDINKASHKKNDSLNIPIDLANVAVRKNRFRDRRKTKSSPIGVLDDSLSSCKEVMGHENTNLLCKNLNIGTLGNEFPRALSIPPKNDNLHTKVYVTKKGVKRKSPSFDGSSKHSLSGHSSSGLVESSFSETENILVNNKISLNNNSNSFHLDNVQKSRISGVSGVSDTSISPAYSSDFSIRTTRRRGRKVIAETPESDKGAISHRSHSGKSSVESLLKETVTNSEGEYSSHKSNTNLPVSSSSYATSPEDIVRLSCCNSELDGKPSKKLRSSNDSSLCDMFKIESIIKSQQSSTAKEANLNNEKQKLEGNCTKSSAKQKLKTSPVLKEINIKEVDCKKNVYTKGKKVDHKEVNSIKLVGGMVKENKKKGRQRDSDKYIKKSPHNTCPKSFLVPPSEVIPKFEHINKWLKNTEENSAILLSSDNSFESPEANIRPSKLKSKLPVSLSPRIKRKLKVAKSSLEEEQKLFEELHGSDYAKRQSDDVEEVVSITSTQEKLELSEKVLEKLYGTVWQKHGVLPKSEPRKNRKENSSNRNVPKTERKKQRTSIYDAFSSSSSEDRFEEFLENVRRGKVDLTQRGRNRRSSTNFINDSDSDSSCSLVYYQNIVSSAIKDEVRQLRQQDVEKEKKPSKINRRRLSFGSSKDDCSENGKADIKSTGKGKTPATKNRKKGRKKKSENDCEENGKSDVLNGFNFVTSIKLSDKKSDGKLSTRTNTSVENEVPIVIGKSKTPKSTTKNSSVSNTAEKLRAKYLGDDFKVPRTLTPVRTPTKSVTKEIPASPALSFLSSLSEMTAGLPCHPGALVFKKDFKNKKEELTKKLFSLYNSEVFENKLPADMLIQWNTRMTSTSGYCYNKRIYSNNQIFRSSRIVLSTKILDRADRLRDTFIHELCHAATWIVNGTSDGHGPNWRAWADKANRRFPELPVIKRCHDYAISTKFTYKCMSCGYCIGRHSKSLDTDRKRCGYCYGKFQVFVTAKMSSASVTSGSDSVKTQRNPTGFALFVKENYATIKKENNLPHGQVMKLLSQKFAEVKISKQSSKEPVIT